MARIPTREQPVYRLCLPQSLWEEAIQKAHESSGHQSVRVTLTRLLRNLYFPGMRREVLDRVRTCLACQKKQGALPDQRHTLGTGPTGYPFQKVHVDFVDMVTPSKRSGATQILTVIDSFTKFILCIPMTSTTADATIRALENRLFSVFGIPEWIHSDCGRQFTSRLYQTAMTVYGIKHSDTTPYNAKSNGQVERIHREIKKMLRASLTTADSWEDKLPDVQAALNTNTPETTLVSPFEMLFGHDPSCPLDVLYGDPNTYPASGQYATSHGHYAEQLRKRIRLIQAYARENLGRAVRRQRRLYHQERKELLPGSLVWLFTPVSKPGTGRKLNTYWTGPYVVVAAPGTGCLLTIKAHPSWAKHPGDKVQTVSIDRVKLYRDGSEPNPPTGWEDTDMFDGDEHAEALTGMPQQPPTPAPAAAVAAQGGNAATAQPAPENDRPTAAGQTDSQEPPPTASTSPQPGTSGTNTRHKGTSRSTATAAAAAAGTTRKSASGLGKGKPGVHKGKFTSPASHAPSTQEVLGRHPFRERMTKQTPDPFKRTGGLMHTPPPLPKVARTAAVDSPASLSQPSTHASPMPADGSDTVRRLQRGDTPLQSRQDTPQMVTPPTYRFSPGEDISIRRIHTGNSPIVPRVLLDFANFDDDGFQQIEQRTLADATAAVTGTTQSAAATASAPGQATHSRSGRQLKANPKYKDFEL